MNTQNPVATLEMENGAQVKIELNPEEAPNTVNNFIDLANKGFYDGLKFHRVIPGFMIQGGCPLGSGTGGPGYKIKGEFSANDYPNELKCQRGALAMARSQHYDSAGSQFFITVADASHLNGEYAPFGTVIEGMDEVDRIVSVPSDHRDKPIENEIIKSIRVDTFGVNYSEPEIL